jgi:hypothetical protein
VHDDDPLAVVAAAQGVPSALAAARDGIDARLRDRGRRRTGAEVTAESLLRGAAASASLAGSSCHLDDLRAGRADAVAAGCLRLSVGLLGLLPVWRTSPLQALARMHTLASDDDVPAESRGRPATRAGAARLRDLAGVLTRPTSAPALAVAAIVHAELATAEPFGSADAVVARAAERLVLVDRGVDPASVTVPEAGHAADPQAYVDGLGAYAVGGPAGVTAWLLHAAQAYTRGAQAAPLGPDVAGR